MVTERANFRHVSALGHPFRCFDLYHHVGTDSGTMLIREALLLDTVDVAGGSVMYKALELDSSRRSTQDRYQQYASRTSHSELC